MALSAQLRQIVDATTGFLPVGEDDALHDAALSAAAGTWLEIGTYCGKSTLILADAARQRESRLVTVDHHHGSEENQPGWEWHDTSMVDPRSGRLDTLPFLRPALDTMLDVTTAVVGDTRVVAQWWGSPITLLFLDGNHTEETAQHDFRAFARHLVPGGLLLVHDVFPDPVDGGQAPWHVVQSAIGGGAFDECSVHGSLRVLVRR